MPKKLKTFRMNPDTINVITEVAATLRLTQDEIVERAVLRYWEEMGQGLLASDRKRFAALQRRMRKIPPADVT